MNESELRGVKCLAGCAAGIGHWRLTGRMRVELFAAERVADLGKVNADLVRPAGFEAAFEDGVVVQMFHWADMRHGSLRALRQALTPALCRRERESDAAAEAVAAIAGQPGVDRLRFDAA